MTQGSEIVRGDSLPACPEWLLPAAVDEWNRLAPSLAERGVLRTADLAAFAAYCQNYARWVEAERFMAEHGDTYVSRDDKGNVKGMGAVPQFAIAQKCLLSMHKFATDFGLTPPSRAKAAAAAADAAAVDQMLQRIAQKASPRRKIANE